MNSHDSIIKPVLGRKPTQLGDQCVMVANQPDFECLGRLLKTAKSGSQQILMSRLNFGYDNTTLSVLGPFIGAPYAVILLESLIVWGIRQVVFFGWCGAVATDVNIGDVIIPDKAFIDDGTSKSYAAPAVSEAFPSDSIQTLIKLSCKTNNINFHEGPIWSTDAIFRETDEKVRFFQKKNALAVEMEAAALFSVGGFRNIDVGCILIVSDELSSLKWKPGFRTSVFRERRNQVCEMISSLWSH